jgi:hypothetical protein
MYDAVSILNGGIVGGQGGGAEPILVMKSNTRPQPEYRHKRRHHYSECVAELIPFTLSRVRIDQNACRQARASGRH